MRSWVCTKISLTSELSKRKTQKNKHKIIFCRIFFLFEGKIAKSYSVSGWDGSWKVDNILSSSLLALAAFTRQCRLSFESGRRTVQVSNCWYKFFLVGLVCSALCKVLNFSWCDKAAKIICSFFNLSALWLISSRYRVHAVLM